MNRRAPPPPIPLTLIAGAPGAGKSRLIRSLVTASPPGSILAILTGSTRSAAIADMRQADIAGCLCCAGSADVLTLLEQRLRALDNSRITAFSRVLIELGGLADPLPALALLKRHPYLALRFALTGPVTMVDPVSGGTMLDRLPVARHQVTLAARLVVGGDDTMPADLAGRLAGLNPDAAMIGPDAGPGPVLDGLAALDPTLWPAPLRRQFLALGIAGPRRAIRTDEQGEHGAEDRLFSHDRPVSPADLDRFVEYFRADGGALILRANGTVTRADGTVTGLESVLGRVHLAPGTAASDPAMQLNLVVAAGQWDRIAVALASLLSPAR